MKMLKGTTTPRPFLALTLALALGLAACDSADPGSGATPALSANAATARNAASPAGPSASGHTNLTIEGGLQTFSFHARTNQDGTVAGTFQVKSRGQNVTAHGTIDCLTVDGNRAFLNAVLTKVNDGNPFGLAAGDRFYFGVEDNGEGKGVPDAWTDFLGPVATTSCPDFGVEMVPNEGGNIQVKP